MTRIAAYKAEAVVAVLLAREEEVAARDQDRTWSQLARGGPRGPRPPGRGAVWLGWVWGIDLEVKKGG